MFINVHCIVLILTPNNWLVHHGYRKRSVAKNKSMFWIFSMKKLWAGDSKDSISKDFKKREQIFGLHHELSSLVFFFPDLPTVIDAVIQEEELNDTGTWSVPQTAPLSQDSSCDTLVGSETAALHFITNWIVSLSSKEHF